MNQSIAPLAKQVFESLTHQNIPEKIDEVLAEPLYGKDIYTSVSRMESFYRCQYQYFSRYGLRLKERCLWAFASSYRGIFHEALDQFFKLLIMNQRNLSELTDQEVNLLAEEVLNSILGDARFLY